MTAPAAAIGRPAVARRLPFTPAEGWTTLIAAALLVLPVAWSIGDAHWVPGHPDETDYLPWVGLLGLAWGFAGAKLGRGRWATHLAGAVIGALLALLIAGTFALAQSGGPSDPLDLTSIPARLHAVGLVALKVWKDLAVDGLPFTSETAHYDLWFAAVLWSVGQAVGYSVFGHRRPVDAIVVAGLVLLVNMITITADQTHLLVVLSLAGLVLLVRAHAFDEQSAWIRRRIGDPAAVASLYRRGGSVFIVAAVLAALMLTATASSAPLQGWWKDLPTRLSGVVEWLQRVAPGGADTRGIGAVGFGREATTSGQWAPSDAIAFRAQLPAGDGRVYKWRVGTYAEYTKAGWRWGPTTAVSRNAGAAILAGTLDDPAPFLGRQQVKIRITPDAYSEKIISPMTVSSVDQPATADLSGDLGRFVSLTPDGGGGSYVVTALVPTFGGTATGAITENRLRAAGADYPADIKTTYLALPEGSIGPAATALRTDILATVPRATVGKATVDGRTAYDVARGTERYLLSNRFTYAANVIDLTRARCGGMSTVECFATIRTGYCEYYASTMAVLLRSQGIPARIAYGFLGSKRDASGVEIVPASLAHWWVEVFFPGYGWVEFDPTGGDVGRPEPIPSGPATEAPSTGPIRTPGEDNGDIPSGGPDKGGGGSGTTTTGSGPFVAIAGILLIGLLALALAARRRMPERPMHPDQAWGSLARWARRAGLGPRPAQTIYEFAGAVSEAMPAAHVDLATVARAKVEVAYGRRDLGDDRLRTVAGAYRRLRLALIRFALRPRRPRRR